MKEQNYQALREIIIKAVPEILELKMGCEVLIGCVVFDWSAELNQKEIDKILGRDITLADCVYAIHNKYNFIKQPNQPEVSIAIDDLVNCHWNLLDNNLDNQSQETKEFLFELLKDK